MNYDLQLISLLFFASTLIYIFWGIYIIRKDSKESTNKLFFIVCMSIAIWALGFGMANSAGDVQTALFWHRFAALGWTTSYGFILHFLLLLTNGRISKKRKRLFWLIHIPSAISFYIFSISGKIAPKQYNLIKINYGWLNKLTNNHWDSFFNIYYMSYMAIGIFIVWNWQRKLQDKKIAKRGQLIVGALIISSLIGTFTDRIASSSFKFTIPQMAPLLVLAPTWTMYHSARHYGVMKRENIKKSETVISQEDKKHLFSSLSLAFYLGGFFILISEYIALPAGSSVLMLPLVRGLAFIGIGTLLRLIQNIEKESVKENLTTIVLLVSIPIVLLQFTGYASITIWAFPLVIILSSIVFTSRILLVTTTIVAISTQILIWILQPQLIVYVDKFHYVGRIGILFTAFLMASYINQLYLEKINENEFQARFQKMNARISSEFISINKENIDEKFNYMLEEVGLFFNPDLISIFIIDDENGSVTYSHEWCKDGIENKKEAFKSVLFEEFSWWKKQLLENKFVSIEDTGKMPKIARNEQEELNKLNVKSVVAVPVESEDGFSSFMMISSIDSYRKWPDNDIKLLHILANLISDALIKISSEKEVEFLAYYDSLTGLPNRNLFKNRVNKDINSAKDFSCIMSIMYIDLDNFRSVNGIIGYEGGDLLLKKVAKRLESVVCKACDVSRFSGDEFMICQKNMKEYNDIAKTADKIMEVFREPFTVYGQDFLMTCSVGIARHPVDGKDATELVENAFIAMEYVKQQGKSQYALCTPKMKEEADMRMSLLNDLYGALERDELVVYYQPQVNLQTGKINGAEALLRWIHPERGMISPGIFIPLAEENGLINSIGRWVMKTASRQNKKWQDMNLPPLKMGVNLSAAQLIDVNIVSTVESVLEETGLDPKYLELEITESLTFEKVGYIEKVLNHLRATGLSISIDDFGAEHSSFSRLKLLPIDGIKIDMEFVQGIEKSNKDRTITKMMINLAKGLGVNVIAEGVETKTQLEFLKDNQCDDVQGYYHYKPMPAEELEEILRNIN